MHFPTLMHELGADRHPLTQEQQAHIRREGYLILPGVFNASEVRAFNSALDSLVIELALKRNDADGGYRIHDLIGREAFDAAWSHPLFLSVARFWLQDEFKPMSLNYRSPFPGGGQQHLHSDQTTTPYCQAIIASNT